MHAKVFVGSRKEDHPEHKEEEIMDQQCTHQQYMDDSASKSLNPTRMRGDLDSKKFHGFL